MGLASSTQGTTHVELRTAGNRGKTIGMRRTSALACLQWTMFLLLCCRAICLNTASRGVAPLCAPMGHWVGTSLLGGVAGRRLGRARGTCSVSIIFHRDKLYKPDI